MELTNITEKKLDVETKSSKEITLR